jgi:hypothetical protein
MVNWRHEAQRRNMAHPATEQRRMKEIWLEYVLWLWLDSRAFMEKDFILLSLNYEVTNVCWSNGVAIRRPYVNVVLCILFVHHNTVCRCLERYINILNSCDWGQSQSIGEPLRESLLPEFFTVNNQFILLHVCVIFLFHILNFFAFNGFYHWCTITCCTVVLAM